MQELQSYGEPLGPGAANTGKVRLGGHILLFILSCVRRCLLLATFTLCISFQFRDLSLLFISTLYTSRFFLVLRGVTCCELMFF